MREGIVPRKSLPGVNQKSNRQMFADPIQPLVSVGITTYSRPEGLRRTLQCISGQTYRNLEIIVSDDCSPGREFRERDKRVRYFRHDPNRGAIWNYNFVLGVATGKYFMWSDDDDIWDKDFVNVLQKLLAENEGAVSAMGNYEKAQPGGRRIRSARKFDNNWTTYESLRNYLKTGDYNTFHGLHRTEALKKIGGYHTDSRPFFHCSDYLTVLKMLLQGRAVFTEEVLFLKVDSGACFTRFDRLRNLEFNRQLIRRIFRFSFFPVFYFYNTLYSISYLLRAKFRVLQKLTLICYALLYYLKENIRFGGEAGRGLGCVLRGIVSRASNRLAP